MRALGLTPAARSSWLVSAGPRAAGPKSGLRRRAEGGTVARQPARERPSERIPEIPKLHVALGLAYWGRNDVSACARRRSGAPWRSAPSSAEAHNWLGVALSEAADLPGAIAELRKAVELDPEVRPCVHESRRGARQERRLRRGGRGLREGAGARAEQPRGAHEPRDGAPREG